MTDEQAAKSATAAMCKRVNPNSLGLEAGDLMQEARLGIWKQRGIIAKLESQPSRDRAMVGAGKLAIIGHLREKFGRTPEVRRQRAAIRVQISEDHEATDHWAGDPQRLAEAMDMWRSIAKLPVKLQMLVTLFAEGYLAVDIAEFIGASEGRVSQLKTKLGDVLGAMT